MKQMHKRLLLLFYHLYSSEKPITSERLIDLCGVTSKTIKNDIGELKDYLKIYDAEYFNARNRIAVYFFRYCYLFGIRSEH